MALTAVMVSFSRSAHRATFVLRISPTDFTLIVSGYLLACKNSQCSASDDVSIGQCKSFDNGVWAEWFCIDCGGK